jgi:hypothetical protein
MGIATIAVKLKSIFKFATWSPERTGLVVPSGTISLPTVLDGQTLTTVDLAALAGATAKVSSGFGTYATKLKTCTVPAQFQGMVAGFDVYLNKRRAQRFLGGDKDMFEEHILGQFTVDDDMFLYIIEGTTLYFYAADDAASTVHLVEPVSVLLGVGTIKIAFFAKVPPGIKFIGAGKGLTRLESLGEVLIEHAVAFRDLTLTYYGTYHSAYITQEAKNEYFGLELRNVGTDFYGNSTSDTLLYTGQDEPTEIVYAGCDMEIPHGYLFETLTGGGKDTARFTGCSGRGALYNDGHDSYIVVQDCSFLIDSKISNLSFALLSVCFAPSATKYQAVLKDSSFISLIPTDPGVFATDAAVFGDAIHATGCIFEAVGPVDPSLPEPTGYDIKIVDVFGNEWKRSKFWGCTYRTLLLPAADTSHTVPAGLRYRFNGGATGANTAETELGFITLHNGAFEFDNATAEFVVEGGFAANANNKTVRIKFGGVTVLDTGALAVNDSGWRATCRITRTAAATQIITTEFICNGQTKVKKISGTLDLAQAHRFSVTGQNGTASASDIMVSSVAVDWRA